MDLISFECFNRLSVENNVHLVWLTLFEQLGIYGWNLKKKKKKTRLVFVFKTYWPGSSFQPEREREQTIPWSLYLDSSLFVFRTEIRGPGGRSNRIGRGSNQEQSAINRAPKKKQHGGERVRLPGVKARERERERERESGSVMKRHKKEIRIQQKRENKMKRRGVRETNPAGSLAGSRCSPKSHVTRVLLVDLNERCNESVWRHREDPIIKTRVPFGNAEASHASHAKWLEWETDFRWRHYCFGTNGTACKYLA